MRLFHQIRLVFTPIPGPGEAAYLARGAVAPPLPRPTWGQGGRRRCPHRFSGRAKGLSPVLGLQYSQPTLLSTWIARLAITFKYLTVLNFLNWGQKRFSIRVSALVGGAAAPGRRRRASLRESKSGRSRAGVDGCVGPSGPARGRVGARVVQFLYVLLTVVLIAPFLLHRAFVLDGNRKHTNPPFRSVPTPFTPTIPLEPLPPSAHLRTHDDVASTQTELTTPTAASATALMRRFQELKKSFSSYHAHGSGKSPIHHIIDLCDPSALPEAWTPPDADTSRLKIGQLNTFYGFRQTLQLDWFSHWMVTDGEQFDVLSLNELVSWDADTLANRAAAWGYPHSAFLKASSGFNLGIISRQGLPIRVLGRHADKPFAHGALHVEICDERGKNEDQRPGRVRVMRFIVTHLSPFDAYVREREALHLSFIATGAFLPEQNSKLSGPRHLWIRGWGPRATTGPRLRNHRARVLLPSAGRTPLYSILQLAARKHGMQVYAPSEICAVFDGVYWGDLLTQEAQERTILVEIGSLLYGHHGQDLGQDAHRGTEHLVDPSFFPEIDMYYGRGVCSDLRAKYRKATPLEPSRHNNVTGNHSDVPTFIMGDLNSLSPGDDAFYRASGLAAHVDALRFNQDGPDGVVDKRKLEIGNRLHRKFMLRDRKRKDPSRIDYRPVQALLQKGWLDLLAAAGHSDVDEAQPFKYTVPTAVQADFMHLQRMRLDGILANPAAVAAFGLRASKTRKLAYAAKSINSPCTEILSDHLPVAVTLQWHDADEKDIPPLTTSSAVCDAHRLCKWKRMLADAEVAWKAKVEAVVSEHSVAWAAEDAIFGKPIVSKRGESCTSACFQQRDHIGRPMVCEKAGLARLNQCARVTAQFPCYHGCVEQYKAVDAPAFDGNLNDNMLSSAGASCVLLKEEPEAEEPVVLNCDGAHPATMRLCSCRKPFHWSVMGKNGETCDVTCQRHDAICTAAGFEKMKSCANLTEMHSVCRGESGGGAVNGEEQSGRRNGKLSCKEIQTPELFGPSFDRELGLCLVSTKLSSLYENVVSGTMDATRGAEMLFGLCSSEPPIGRQNMCPCVK